MELTTKTKQTLRIKTNRLGDAEEIVTFLDDIIFAYNSLRRMYQMIHFAQDRFESNEPFDRDYIFTDIYENRSPRELGVYIRSLQVKYSILPQKDNLEIVKIQTSSPGIWDFLGFGQVLEQIRLAIKDYREYNYRKGQKDYRKDMDNLKVRRLKAEVVRQEIEVLKSMGYTTEEIRVFFRSYSKPLDNLSYHVNSLLIEDATINEVGAGSTDE